MSAAKVTVVVQPTIVLTSWLTVHPTVTTTVYNTIQVAFTPNTDGFSSTSVSQLASSTPSDPTGALSTTQATTPTDTTTTDQAITPSPSSSPSSSHKRAVIGGLSGAIAALFLIGILIFFLMRTRRKHDEASQLESHPEKAAASQLSRTRSDAWTDLLGRTPSQVSQASPQVSVDENHRIIRMNLSQWVRPFADGRGEGIRDSIAPGRFKLRVTNPDPPRPLTGHSSLWSDQRSTRTSFSTIFGSPYFRRSSSVRFSATEKHSRSASGLADRRYPLQHEFKGPLTNTTDSRADSGKQHDTNDMVQPAVNPSGRREAGRPDSQILNHSLGSETIDEGDETHRDQTQALRSDLPLQTSIPPRNYLAVSDLASHRLTAYSDPFDLDHSSDSEAGLSATSIKEFPFRSPYRDFHYPATRRPV